jgi:hypothetical protein
MTRSFLTTWLLRVVVVVVFTQAEAAVLVVTYALCLVRILAGLQLV